MTYSEWRLVAESEFSTWTSGPQLSDISVSDLISAYNAGLTPKELFEAYNLQKNTDTAVPPLKVSDISKNSKTLSVTYKICVFLSGLFIGFATVAFIYVVMQPITQPNIQVGNWTSFASAVLVAAPFLGYATTFFLLGVGFQWMNHMLLLQWRVSRS